MRRIILLVVAAVCAWAQGDSPDGMPDMIVSDASDLCKAGEYQVMKTVEGREVFYECVTRGRKFAYWRRISRIPDPPKEYSVDFITIEPRRCQTIRIDYPGAEVGDAFRVEPATIGKRISVHVRVVQTGKLAFAACNWGDKAYDPATVTLRVERVAMLGYQFHSPWHDFGYSPPEFRYGPRRLR